MFLQITEIIYGRKKNLEIKCTNFGKLIIPILIWWVESKIAKRKGETLQGPSVLMLSGIAISIFILIVGLLLSQSTNAPSGSEYFPAKVENGKVISGGFKTVK